PDPSIEDSRDAIIKVTACAIVALISVSTTAMHRSDILGHEKSRRADVSSRIVLQASVLPKYLGLTDEQVLFLSDIFPTGYKAAEMDHFAIRFEVTTSHAASL